MASLETHILVVNAVEKQVRHARPTRRHGDPDDVVELAGGKAAKLAAATGGRKDDVAPAIADRLEVVVSMPGEHGRRATLKKLLKGLLAGSRVVEPLHETPRSAVTRKPPKAQTPRALAPFKRILPFRSVSDSLCDVLTGTRNRIPQARPPSGPGRRSAVRGAEVRLLPGRAN